MMFPSMVRFVVSIWASQFPIRHSHVIVFELYSVSPISSHVVCFLVVILQSSSSASTLCVRGPGWHFPCSPCLVIGSARLHGWLFCSFCMSFHFLLCRSTVGLLVYFLFLSPVFLLLFSLVAVAALSAFRLRCSGLSIGSVFLRLWFLSLFVPSGVPAAVVLLVF